MLPRWSHEGTTNHSEEEDDEPKRPLSEFYPYIRCALCSRFLIDATTIIECLHTFCKSCIVKHFFYNNRCPTCSIVVHQTQPTYNIRPDRQLQDIVYKMVPFLEECKYSTYTVTIILMVFMYSISLNSYSTAERKQMCQFYKERGLDVPNTVVISPPGPVVIKRQKKENIPPSVFTIPPELDVSLLLEFVGRYVRVSGEATVRHVELFIRRKMELSSACQVDVVCGDHLLDHFQSLKDIQSFVGEEALQDGLLVLHFGLVLPSQP
ncbi:hypothetical protein F7725_024339 [Dissostichus mawsoni]|uniref:RING-type domain-containing protein n=1 Tax=Dissostichus mawsoni TaxID=36200 RepID=A0A7J5Y209_DISMA|nr:hypothetical protein F7725_024339 [Dissostichus mawsoni]